MATYWARRTLLVSLAYTVVSTLDYAQYLALSRKTLLLIAAFVLVALLGVPLYFVVSLVYSVVRKVKI